jgi:hypothetical protein
MALERMRSSKERAFVLGSSVLSKSETTLAPSSI